MFLHSGASLHGHEYSSRPVNQPHIRKPLLRSAFRSPPNSSSFSIPSPSAPSSLSALPSSAAASASAAAALAASVTSRSPAPIIRSNTVSSDGTRPGRPLHHKPHLRHLSEDFASQQQRAPVPVVRFHDPVTAKQPLRPTSQTSLPVPAPRSPTSARLRPRQTPQEPMSEDDASSILASEASFASDNAVGSATSSKPGRRRQRAPRKSTTFVLAHPAPKLSTKKQLLKKIRPTLLMQLQQLSPGCRPIPVIDVYPTSLIAGDVVTPRFSKRFPRLFGINGELGIHDTILVKSDDYDTRSHGSESEGEDDGLEHRALLAVLSPLRRGNQSEIVLEDGTIWTTTSLPNGSFDFVRMDKHGRLTTARWVRRVVNKPPASGATCDGSAAEPQCKYTFSIIDPQSRRHPVLATLSKATLDILDQYTTVSPSSASRYPPSRSRTQSPSSHDPDESNDDMSHDEDGSQTSVAPSMVPASKGRVTLPVEEDIKTFISVSAVFVALQCGWGRLPVGASLCAAPPGGITRNATGSLRASQDQTSNDSLDGADSTDGRGRRNSARYRAPSNVSSTFEIAERDLSPSMSPKLPSNATGFPRKASSTGAAYVRRRKQMQIPETSDTEHPVPAPAAPRRRSRAFSRLSGDFSPMLTSKSLPPVPATEGSPSPVGTAPVEVFSPTPVSRHASMILSSGADLQTRTSPSPLREGRSVSAYYSTSPLTLPDDTNGASRDIMGASVVGIHNGTYPTNGSQTWQSKPGPPPLERGGAQRWKKLGSWFRKLGGGH